MITPHILTIDLAPLGPTTLWEIRDSLSKEFEANKDGAMGSFAEMAAVSSGIALKKMDDFLALNDVRRPSLV